MTNLKYYVYLISFLVILVSCKNDNKEIEKEEGNKIVKETGNKKIINNNTKPKKKIEPIDNGDNLIFPRLIFNDDTKLFAGALSTSGLTKIFSDPEKKYIVFTPSNDAFKRLSNEKMSALFSDRELLTKNLKGHIIEGNLDFSQLSSKISSNGVYSVRSLSGSKIKASLVGNEMIVKDSNGKEAKVIGNKSITTENGVIYIIDKVLNIN